MINIFHVLVNVSFCTLQWAELVWVDWLSHVLSWQWAELACNLSVPSSDCLWELYEVYTAAAAAAAAVASIGVLFVLSGNMMTYMVSYMHQRVDPSVTYANIIWVNSITTMSQGFFMLLGGLLEKQAGPRLTCLLGCSIFRWDKAKTTCELNGYNEETQCMELSNTRPVCHRRTVRSSLLLGCYTVRNSIVISAEIYVLYTRIFLGLQQYGPRMHKFSYYTYISLFT